MKKMLKSLCIAAVMAALGGCAAQNQASATPPEGVRLAVSNAPAPALAPAVTLVRSEAKTSKAKKPVAKVGAHARPKTAAKAAPAAKPKTTAKAVPATQKLPKPAAKSVPESPLCRKGGTPSAGRLNGKSAQSLVAAGAVRALTGGQAVTYQIAPQCDQMVQLVAEGRLQEATALCESTLHGCPEISQSFLNEVVSLWLAVRVTVLTDKTRTADARAVVNWALERFPGNPELQCRLAELELRQANDKAALSIFQNLNWDGMTHNYTVFWRRLHGLVLARNGLLAESRALIPDWGYKPEGKRDGSAVQAMPDTRTAAGLQAYWLLLLSVQRSPLSSEPEGYRWFLDGAIALAPNSPQVMRRHGLLLWSQGDKDGGAALMRQAADATTGEYRSLLRGELYRLANEPSK